ncbi:MAG TPA: TonB-dependent receptor [Terriglobia bacterium]|nr:TonB-dependent receptor [Terriglobia bacterium]
MSNGTSEQPVSLEGSKLSGRLSSLFHVPSLIPTDPRDFSSIVLLVLLTLEMPGAATRTLRAQARPEQLANLNGRVLKDQSTPLPDAVCTLTGSLLPSEGVTVRTDYQGRFAFAQLSPGSYRLACAASGYRPMEEQLDLTSEFPGLDLILAPEKVVQQRVEVQAQAPAAALEQGAPPATLSNTQITDLPLVEQKFKAVLPLIPGVVRTPDGKINIKGQPENQGMLLLDGAENVDPVTGSFAVDVPLQAVESMNVSKNAYRADYGGFSGGLTTLNTRPPLGQWQYEVQNLTPNPRFETGTLMGIADFNPAFYVTGPVIANRLNFAESVEYDVDKQIVRGLAWPHDEIRSHDFKSFTTLQYIFSPHHLTTVTANVFPITRQFADINSLIPQTASSDYGQHGYSVALTDHYLTSSGVMFTTIAEGMSFGSYGRSQGPADMLVTPDGWGGNFFNTYDRESNEEQIGETIALQPRAWHGKHEFITGGNFIQRAFSGTSDSRPVQILGPAANLLEQISFKGSGALSASDAEGAAFIQDHWTMTEQLGVDLGLRFAGQTLGAPVNLAPRLGVVYSPGKGGKTVIRAGAGIFYSHVPLLLGGFPGNPVREETLFNPDGTPAGPPLAFPNLFGDVSNPQSPGLSLNSPERTPYDVTWSLEADRELVPNVTLRVSVLSSRSYDEDIVDPITGLPAGGAALVVSPTGGSAYHEIEGTVHVRLSAKSEWNFSYVNSKARGDLNSLTQIYVPFEAPVIQPDAYANLPSDIPNRLITWGCVPTRIWKIEASPVIDWHSGFPFSYLDQYQNYVGVPDSHRFPRFFSLDLKLSKEFHLELPLLKGHLLRGSLSVFNLTNHTNPRDVYNNLSSTYFDHFPGLQHRFFDSEFDIVY